MQKRRQKSKTLFETLYTNTLKRKKLSQRDGLKKPKQIVFVGAPQVGKTNLILTFLKNEFNASLEKNEESESLENGNTKQNLSPNVKPNVESDTISAISELSFNPQSDVSLTPKLESKVQVDSPGKLEELELQNQKLIHEIQEYKRVVQELEQKTKELSQVIFS